MRLSKCRCEAFLIWDKGIKHLCDLLTPRLASALGATGLFAFLRACLPQRSLRLLRLLRLLLLCRGRCVCCALICLANTAQCLQQPNQIKRFNRSIQMVLRPTCRLWTACCKCEEPIVELLDLSEVGDLVCTVLHGLQA